MEEENWVEIDEFPGYAVSDLGRVINTQSEQLKTQSVNQQGHAHVILMKDGEQYRRGVAQLVARAFLDDPPRTWSTPTPIHLDLDKTNCRADNLMWRPRWFATDYHKMLSWPNQRAYRQPVTCITTEHTFDTVLECCQEYGLLPWHVMDAMVNRTYVWPGHLEFALI